MITTASLQKLQQLCLDLVFDLRRFRPNLVIETKGEPAFAENEWMGRIITIGDEVQLHITVGCPRCVMTTLPQANLGLAKDEKVLRTIAQHNRVDLGAYGIQACMGVYAEVVQGGTIRKNDPTFIS